MKLFIATWRARILRAEAGYSRVREKKTGLPPRGFTMGKRAVRMSRILLTTSGNEESSGTESIRARYPVNMNNWASGRGEAGKETRQPRLPRFVLTILGMS
jgi:hypothetical protein